MENGPLLVNRGRTPTNGFEPSTSFNGHKRVYQDPEGNLALSHAVHAVLPSMIVIPVGDGVLMALVSLRPAAL